MFQPVGGLYHALVPKNHLSSKNSNVFIYPGNISGSAARVYQQYMTYLKHAIIIT